MMSLLLVGPILIRQAVDVSILLRQIRFIETSYLQLNVVAYNFILISINKSFSEYLLHVAT
jgi:hypothetical protein